MKYFIYLIALIPFGLSAQNITFETLNPRLIVDQIYRTNQSEDGGRTFNRKPDSVSIISSIFIPNNSSNLRLYYGDDGLMSSYDLFIEDSDSVVYSYKILLSYDSDNALASATINFIKNSMNELIGHYDYNYDDGVLVSEKAYIIHDDIFQGDSIQLLYENGRISSYKNFVGYKPDEWFEEYSIDSINYVNGLIKGYDEKIYEIMPDSIRTTYYRYKNTSFYKNNDDIFSQIDPVYSRDTFHFMTMLPEFDEAEGLLYKMSYDKYRFNQAQDSFILYEKRSAEDLQDTIIFKLENFKIPFVSNITTTFNSDNKLSQYYVETNNGSLQQVDYDYAECGRVGKVIVDNFVNFHRSYVYEYEFDSEDNLTIFRELVDETFGSPLLLYTETQFFYFNGLLNAKNTESALKIYPNPALNELHVESGINLTNSQISMFDIHGKLVNYYKGGSKVFDISQLQSGIYFIKIATPGQNILQKFVKL